MQMFRVTRAPPTLHLCTVKKLNKLTDLTKLDFGDMVLWMFLCVSPEKLHNTKPP